MRNKAELDRRNQYARRYGAYQVAYAIESYLRESSSCTVIVEAETESLWDDIVVVHKDGSKTLHQAKQQYTDFPESEFAKLIKGIRADTTDRYRLVFPSFPIVTGKGELRVLREICRRVQAPGANVEHVLTNLRKIEKGWYEHIKALCHNDHGARNVLEKLTFDIVEDDHMDMMSKTLIRSCYPRNSDDVWNYIRLRTIDADGSIALTPESIVEDLRKTREIVAPNLPTDLVGPQLFLTDIKTMLDAIVGGDRVVTRPLYAANEQQIPMEKLHQKGARFIIIGKPGVGKTSTARAISQNLADGSRFPIWIDSDVCVSRRSPLMDFAKSKLSSYIAYYAEDRTFEDAMRKGHVCLIIDGLRMLHESLIAEIIDICSRYPNVALIATSKSGDADPRLPLSPLSLRELNSADDKVSFIRQYLGLKDESEAQLIIRRFGRTLYAQSASPYILARALSEYDVNGTLPESGMAIVKAWVSKELAHFGQVKSYRLTEDLNTIALACMHGPTDIGIITDKGVADQTVEALLGTGLICFHEGSITFSHEILTSYCAARRIANTLDFSDPENMRMRIESEVLGVSLLRALLGETRKLAEQRFLFDEIRRKFTFGEYLDSLSARNDLISPIDNEDDRRKEAMRDLELGYSGILSFFSAGGGFLFTKSRHCIRTAIRLDGEVNAGGGIRYSVVWEDTEGNVERNGVRMTSFMASGTRFDGGRIVAANDICDRMKKRAENGTLSYAPAWRKERIRGIVSVLQNVRGHSFFSGAAKLARSQGGFEDLDPVSAPISDVYQLLKLRMPWLRNNFHHFDADVAIDDFEWAIEENLAAVQYWESKSPIKADNLVELGRCYLHAMELYESIVMSSFSDVQNELSHWPQWPMQVQAGFADTDGRRVEVRMTPISADAVDAERFAIVSIGSNDEPTDFIEREEWYFNEVEKLLTELGRPRGIVHGPRTSFGGVAGFGPHRPFFTLAMALASEFVQADLNYLFKPLSLIPVEI